MGPDLVNKAPQVGKSSRNSMAFKVHASWGGQDLLWVSPLTPSLSLQWLGPAIFWASTQVYKGHS